MSVETVGRLRQILSGYDDDMTVVVCAGNEYVAEGLGVYNDEGHCVSIILVVMPTLGRVEGEQLRPCFPAVRLVSG